jgi:hypothetical protein
VYETGFVLVRRAGLPGDDLGDRLAGGRQPPFPLVRGLWPVVVGQERLPADRALTVLGCEEPPAGLVDRQGRLAPPFGPGVGEGGVVRGRRAVDDLVSDDVGPGELVQVGAACAVAEHPPVLPGLVEPVEVPGNDPAGRLVADLGVAIGTGTDVAIKAADITLLSGDLEGALRLSRRTYRHIVQNLGWAFAYNLAAIPLAAAGVLNPVIAAAAMALSSVSVVANSLRLRRFRRATTAPTTSGSLQASTAAADRRRAARA